MTKLRTVIQIGADGKQAARVFAGLKDDANELDDASQRAGYSMESIGDAASGIPGPLGDVAGLMTGPAGIAAGAAAIGAALWGAAKAAIAVGEEAQTTAFALNATVEEASRLNVAMGQFGVEANDAVDIALQVTGALADSTEIAEKLGFEAGEVIAPMDGVKASIDSWDLLTPVERMKIFGEEGVRQVAKLQRDGRSLSDIMAGLSDFQVIDAREAAKLEKTDAKMRELAATAEGVKTEVGVGVVGSLNDTQNVMEQIGDLWPDVLPDLQGWSAEATTALVSPFAGLMGVISDDLYGAVDSTNTKFQQLPDSIDDATASVSDAASATAGWAGETRSLDDAFKEINDRLSREQMIVDLAGQFDTLREKAEAAWIKTAEGADDAKEAQEDYDQELRNTQREIVGIGKEIGLLPSTVETLIEVSDNGSIADVEERIQNLIRNRELQILVRERDLPGQNGPSDPNTEWTQSPPGTVVNVTMHGQASSREMANAVAQWTANG